MIQIDNLALRLPGLGEDDAKLFGLRVADHLETRLPGDHKSGQLANLDLNLSVPEDAGPEQVAALIAEAIAKAIV